MRPQEPQPRSTTTEFAVPRWRMKSNAFNESQFFTRSLCGRNCRHRTISMALSTSLRDRKTALFQLGRTNFTGARTIIWLVPGSKPAQNSDAGTPRVGIYGSQTPCRGSPKSTRKQNTRPRMRGDSSASDPVPMGNLYRTPDYALTPHLRWRTEFSSRKDFYVRILGRKFPIPLSRCPFPAFLLDLI